MPRLLWTQKEDIGPVPRAGASLAYDAARKCCVLVGGIAHVGNDKYRGQTLRGETEPAIRGATGPARERGS